MLHVYSGNLFGGVETLLVALARFRKLCPTMQPEFALCFGGRLRDDLVGQNTLVHDLGPVRTSRPWTVTRARHRLRRMIEARGSEVVVCHAVWSQAVFGPAIRATHRGNACWLHDAATGRHWIERWAALHPPALAICNSRFTAGTASALFPRVRSEVVFPPTDPSPVRSDRAAVREEIGTGRDAVVIAQASRLEPWKGHRLHLEALHRLRDLPDWECWQIGGPQRRKEAEYAAELRTLAQQLGIDDRVRWLGERSDVPRLLAAADLHCQPNTGPEPFGIAFVEALRAKLPVVTTAIGAAVEIVDSSCGMLTPPGNPDALAAALRRLIGNPELRLRLGEAGPDRARALTDPETQLGELAGLLRPLARAGAPA